MLNRFKIAMPSGLLLLLLTLQTPWVMATPPPAAVDEGLGVPTAVKTPEPTTAEKITALLDQASDKDMYGESERCIRRNQVKHYEVLDSGLLLVHGRRDKLWISQLPRKCIGLRRKMALIMEVRGSQVCANDRFYARQEWERMNNLGLRGQPLGSVSCQFAEFETVSRDQADLIQEAAKHGAFR